MSANLGIRQTASVSGATIYWPAGQPRGGVVCLHGSEGGRAGWNDLNAALFAVNGFVAIAHNYSPPAPPFSHPNIDTVPLEGAERALIDLREQLGPRRCGIGLFGASRGAEHALLLAQLLAEEKNPVLPDAVAVHSPPDRIWPAFIVADFQTGKPWAGDAERPAWTWRGGYERTRPGTPLRVEHFPNPVFIAQGTADGVWGDAMARNLVAGMTAAGRGPEAYFFAGEGHVFGPEARNREWELLVDFFGRHLAGPAPS